MKIKFSFEVEDPEYIPITIVIGQARETKEEAEEPVKTSCYGFRMEENEEGEESE